MKIPTTAVEDRSRVQNLDAVGSLAPSIAGGRPDFEDSKLKPTNFAANTSEMEPGSFVFQDQPFKEHYSDFCATFEHRRNKSSTVEQLRQQVVAMYRGNLPEHQRLLRMYHHLATDYYTLWRFLNSSDRVDEACQNFMAHLEWREQYKVDTILDEHASFQELEDRQELYWSSGKDCSGRPVLVWRMALHKRARSTDELVHMTRYVVYLL